ncbi:MAG: ceramidase domain-containing protein [Chitinophagaceae bacterium]
MSRQIKLLILGVITIALIIIVSILRPIPQDAAFHHFADQTTFWGISNFANVISNIPFLFVGFYGLALLQQLKIYSRVRLMYMIIFIGIILTGVGSAWYHISPDNDRLVYDRIPMTIIFMTFLSITVFEWVSEKLGYILLFPLLILGIASVLWWHYTESISQGDLRLYAFVQFYPMLITPIIFLLFHSKKKSQGLPLLIGVILWYVVAKLAEKYDAPIYSFTGFISGHSIKHIAAAFATLYIVRFFKARYKHVTPHTIIPGDAITP